MRTLLTIVAFLSACAAYAQPTVAFVLTGGGARGIAQIGVLKELEKAGIVPDIIVGSSFGAIVGGLYAAGYSPNQIDSLFHTINWDDVTSFASDTQRESLFYSQKQENDRSLVTFRFRNLDFVPPTAIGGSVRFSELLQEILWKSPYNSVTNFDSLVCTFRAIATDLCTGDPVSLKSGNLATAMRASATFPLRYAPVRWNTDTVLVDGGLVANIPIDAAIALKPDVIILVNTTSDYATISSLTTPWAVADQALTAAMKQRDSEHIKLADFVLEPELGATGTFDFNDIDVLIRAGEREGARMALQIKERLRHSSGAMEAGSSQYFIKNVIVRSTFSIDTATLVKERMMDMIGRDWSVQFKRYHQPRFTDAVHRSGNALAYVRSMSYDAPSQTLTIYVDRGIPTRLTFDRLNDLRRSDIEREVSFETGNELRQSDLERTWQNMHASDVLQNADVMVSRNADSGVHITMHAEDRGNQTIRIGARIDNERYTQGSVDIIHENLFSTGVRVALRGILSQRIGQLAASLELPRIGGTLWTASLKGYTSFRDVWVYQNEPDRPINEPLPQRVDEYSEDRYGFRVSAGRQLERNGVLLGEFRYEQQRYRDLTSDAEPSYQPLTTLRAVARWDDRDQIDFASRGRTIDLTAESSILSLSNSVSFTKFTAAASSVVDLGSVVLTPSASIGAADRTLPSAELFSLGGQDMFFGWREDQQRGRQIVVGNVDARMRLPVRIFFDTYVSLRYDIGAIWENPENIRIADMNHGIGLTVGIDTPVGPARFSMGRSFFFLDDPAAVGWGPLLLYFAIGTRL